MGLAGEALRRGAKAFVGKAIDPADVAPLLRQVFEGKVVDETRAGTTGSPAGPGDELGLTTREREILERVATGKSNKQIAAEFWLSEQTIKYHLTNVYRKLGVSSRTEAARFAYERGLAGNSWPGTGRDQHESPGMG